MSDTYSASDYAGIDAERINIYYGYEQADEEGNWCFTITRDEKEIAKYPYSDLAKHSRYGLDAFDVKDCLLAGIARAIEQGVLAVRAFK